jgi:hypothetical protein
MPALEINGLTIPVLGDSFSEVQADTGDVFTRSTTGKMFGSLGVRKRTWSFQTTPLRSDLANDLKFWIEGNALSWNFDGDLVSGAGVSNTIACNVASYTSGKDGVSFGQAVEIAAGSSFSVDMANKVNIPNGWSITTHGWTLMFWAYHTAAGDGVPSDGWYHYIVTGQTAVVPGTVSMPGGVTSFRNGVSGSYNLHRIISVTDFGPGSGGLWVGVRGRSLLNVDANRRYDDFVFLPFTIPTTTVHPWTSTWASQIYTFANNGRGWPAAPVVRVTGDHVDGPLVTVAPLAICRVDRIDHRNMTYPGESSKPNVKTLNVVMEEL